MYTINIIKHSGFQQKLPLPISNEGYEIPLKITNNEYLELCSDLCEYLDLSRTNKAESVDTKDSDSKFIVEETNLLYCNMSPKQP